VYQDVSIVRLAGFLLTAIIIKPEIIQGFPYKYDYRVFIKLLEEISEMWNIFELH
jgi:pantothenate kinase